MKLEMPEKNYIQNIPFEAELSRIHMQMPHFHPKSLELIYCLEGTVHLTEEEEDHDYEWVVYLDLENKNYGFFAQQSEIKDIVVLDKKV